MVDVRANMSPLSKLISGTKVATRVKGKGIKRDSFWLIILILSKVK